MGKVRVWHGKVDEWQGFGNENNRKIAKCRNGLQNDGLEKHKITSVLGNRTFAKVDDCGFQIGFCLSRQFFYLVLCRDVVSQQSIVEPSCALSRFPGASGLEQDMVMAVTCHAHETVKVKQSK